MKKLFIVPVVVWCIGSAALRPLPAQDPSGELTDERFQELHQQLQPADEPWRTIPWKIALLDAQRAAAQSHKPIFIWAMDGHPLGCT